MDRLNVLATFRDLEEEAAVRVPLSSQDMDPG